jgi:hypothetical protein
VRRREKKAGRRELARVRSPESCDVWGGTIIGVVEDLKTRCSRLANPRSGLPEFFADAPLLLTTAAGCWCIYSFGEKFPMVIVLIPNSCRAIRA